MKENRIIKNVSKYCIFEKEITDKVIINDLITGNRFTQISFSYKTEALIQFMYYCLNYFFKNKTYGEKMVNIQLYNNTYNENNYLFKFKVLLPHIFKIIIKYLSINNHWFNYIFHGLELIDLIKFLDTKNYKSYDYNSLLHYLYNIKYRLLDTQLNSEHEVLYSNWFYILINGISDIISELLYFYKHLLKMPTEKIFNMLRLNNNNKIICQICKLFPINLLYFNKCGHYFCYYCYFYNSKKVNNLKLLKDKKCFLCINKFP